MKQQLSTTTIDSETLEVIENYPGRMPQVVKKVMFQLDIIDDFAIRRAVWRLINDGLVELKSNNDLQAIT